MILKTYRSNLQAVGATRRYAENKPQLCVAGCFSLPSFVPHNFRSFEKELNFVIMWNSPNKRKQPTEELQAPIVDNEKAAFDCFSSSRFEDIELEHGRKNQKIDVSSL